MEQFRFGAPFVEWFSLFGSIEGQVLTGADSNSALFRGGGAGVNWEAGLAGRLMRRESSGTQLAIRLKVHGKHGRDVAPIALIESLLNDPTQTVDDILDGDLLELMISREKAITGGGSVAAAQAMGRYFGIQIGAEARAGGATYVSTFETGEVKTETTREVLGTGIALTGNADPHFPLGLLIEYRFRKNFEQTDDLNVSDLNSSRHRIGMGLHYTGREDLMLGIFASTRLWRGEGEPRTYVYGQIVMQYFF